MKSVMKKTIIKIKTYNQESKEKSWVLTYTQQAKLKGKWIKTYTEEARKESFVGC